MTERWKAVPGFEGRYEVSDQGRVRNMHGRVLSPNNQNSGYHIVHLYSGGRGTRKAHLIHRLVAQAFVAGSGAEVNHLDGVKTHNAAANLEWSTHSENGLHAFATGLRLPPKLSVVGTPLGGGAAIRFAGQKDVELHFRGKATGVVSRCLKGLCGSAYGYTWSRA